MSSENLSVIAEEIVRATTNQPREQFAGVLRRFTHVLCDMDNAFVIAGHINTLIGAPPDRQQKLAETLWQHARNDLEATVIAAEVDLAKAAMLRAIERPERPPMDPPDSRGTDHG